MMVGAFVPTKKRSQAVYTRGSLTAGHLAVKRQRVHYHQHAEMPSPAINSGAQLSDEPYIDQAGSMNGDSAPLGEVVQARPPTPARELPMPPSQFLNDLSDNPEHLDKESFCTSDTAREEDGDECTSAPTEEHRGTYGDDASSVEDKKAVDLAIMREWLDMEPSSSTEEPHSPSSSYQPYASDINRSPEAPIAAEWTDEQMRALSELALIANVDRTIRPNGSINLTPSQLLTPGHDSFLTQASPGSGPDTGRTEGASTQGPLFTCPDSRSSHVSAEEPIVPANLSADTDIKHEEFDVCGSPPLTQPPLPVTDCPPPVTASSLSTTPDYTEMLDVLLTKAKAASEEVTDPEFQSIVKELDPLVLDDGTYEINGRTVTVASSAEFPRIKPYELSAVADVLAKQPPHGETKLNFVYVVRNRNPKDLNKYLPEKTWTNGGKNKEKPTPLNKAMDVQHIGFGASKLPREEVPGYLQLDAEDRAMLRFSMRVYTKAGVKSSKKAYPTAYIILTLKKPIRRLRHARRANQ